MSPRNDELENNVAPTLENDRRTNQTEANVDVLTRSWFGAAATRRTTLWSGQCEQAGQIQNEIQNESPKKFKNEARCRGNGVGIDRHRISTSERKSTRCQGKRTTTYSSGSGTCLRCRGFDDDAGGWTLERSGMVMVMVCTTMFWVR